MRRGCDDEPDGYPNSTRVERWMLVAPSKKQRMTLPTDHPDIRSLQPSYVCAHYLTFDAFKLLCNSLSSVLITSNEAASQELSRITPQQTMARSLLETLPPELFAALVTFLDTSDFIALSLCSQTLWTQAVAWAQSGYLRWRGAYSWAGTPMICVGSKLKVLPQSTRKIFSGNILEVMPEGAESDEEGWLRTSNPARLWYDEATTQFEMRPIPYDDDYREVFWKQINSSGIPQKFHELMAASFPIFGVEAGTRWYLRNLTQNEYICMEAIVTDDGECTVSFVGSRWLTLDILLLWLIRWRGKRDHDTWSWEQLEKFEGVTDEGLGDIMADPTYGPLDDDFWPIWAGNWAGHSLDVVADDVDEGWIDRTGTIDLVSGKILRTLYGLAMAEVGGEESDYWARMFEQSGGVVDLQLMEYSSDSRESSPCR